MTLKDLKPGQYARISKVGGDGALRSRLMDMGLTPGTDLIMEQPAPSGDPLCVRIRSFNLSLRKDDAANIEIEDICYPASSSCANCMGCGRKSKRFGRRMRRRGNP